MYMYSRPYSLILQESFTISFKPDFTQIWPNVPVCLLTFQLFPPTSAVKGIKPALSVHLSVCQASRDILWRHDAMSSCDVYIKCVCVMSVRRSFGKKYWQGGPAFDSTLTSIRETTGNLNINMRNYRKLRKSTGNYRKRQQFYVVYHSFL